jgi:hypothetical protein
MPHLSREQRQILDAVAAEELDRRGSDQDPDPISFEDLGDIGRVESAR